MNVREQKPLKEASAARYLAEGLLEIAGEFGFEIAGEFGFIGFVLYLAITVPIVLITTCLDW
ncbi:MAG TPA: hypothetical protein VKE93_03530 [Candidatus Angelobacter sp.]|nr:hypothetical protein [Candidatus Angelobacter sp.]